MLVLSAVIAYLIGSISFSTLIGRWFGKIDIREHGSGNAGATNTLRVLGARYAIIVLLADIAKGVVAVLLAQALGGGNPWVTYLSALAVIVGHNWPIYFGFRGGKGVATTIGVLLILMPKSLLTACLVAVILIAITRYVSLGALVLAVLTPIAGIVYHGGTGKVVLAVVVGVLTIWRHRKNIHRLLHGQEHRVFSK
ncbi:glycerol-3-phosphate 1-O-acyltransferase PlsY [Alicyclobacillus mengziensis]|uniref:Glycerol-3-phosphate acyltransferase n=1 Tax=Alicyclobacillus mengziensis TaxID=2931921 RepID=A0A9X7Z485_9BACL|nr:glycerol-3-phosphate 1-O-acyltransferase PlsY [Alicyclobacillus mengziensis]QSO45739.1 glycerol-3-phosphate 1-O-acyltransferase PlsY [Alicyclobacillus mengziensis]